MGFSISPCFFSNLGKYFGIPILWSSDFRETAKLIYWIAKREQVQEKREVSIRAGKRVTSLAEQQEFLIAGLPGISTVRARALLRHFKNPLNVFTAHESDLAKVEQIGKETAKRSREVLDKEYERNE